MSNCQHCDRPAHLRGLCIAHYRRFMIYGNALEPWHRPVMGTCSECDRPAVAKDLCRPHYDRLRRTGVLGGAIRRRLTELERYLSFVDQRGPDDCWPWLASRSKQNYGYFAQGDKKGQVPAHRYGFGNLKRPLEPGETVDHTCHNRDPDCPGGDTCEHRACQNPAHWEAVSHSVNAIRAFSTRSEEIIRQRIAAATATRCLKTHCKWGHDTTDPANSYGYGGRRVCKTCARLAARGKHPRQLAAAGTLF